MHTAVRPSVARQRPSDGESTTTSSFMRGLRWRRYVQSTTLVALAIAAASAHAQDIPRISPRQVAPSKTPQAQVAPAPDGSSVYAAAVGSVLLLLCEGENGRKGIGTGSVLRRQGGDGFVLTNTHVVAGARACFAAVKPAGNTPVGGNTQLLAVQVVAIDASRDLAIAFVKALPEHVMPLPLGAIDDVAVGQEVHAIGHPHQLYWSYTRGVVSQIRPKFTMEKGAFVADVIQTQTPISPGNSGGPLLSSAGKLVGVNTFGRVDGQNLNFAVAVNEVRAFVTRVENGEHSAAGSGGDASHAGAGAREAAPDCGFKKKREAESKGRPGALAFGEIGCAGWENAAVLEPHDTSREVVIYVRTSKRAPGEEKDYYDTRYYVDRKSGRVQSSWHDVDGDNRPDYLGIYKDGDPKPVAFEVFNSAAQRN